MWFTRCWSYLEQIELCDESEHFETMRFGTKRGVSGLSQSICLGIRWPTKNTAGSSGAIGDWHRHRTYCVFMRLYKPDRQTERLRYKNNRLPLSGGKHIWVIFLFGKIFNFSYITALQNHSFRCMLPWNALHFHKNLPKHSPRCPFFLHKKSF